MNNFREVSDFSISEISTNQEQLSSELHELKINQLHSNTQNKSENKIMATEIEKLKSQMMNYQSDLGNQMSKLSLIEKEVTIIKNPNINYVSSQDLSNLKQIPFTKTDSNYNSIYKSENDTVELASTNKNTENNTKFEDNLNFLISLKLLENSINSAKDPSQINEHFAIFKNEISNIFNKKDQFIDNLLNKNLNLEEQNQKLKCNLMAYEEENNKGKFCIYCHQTFISKFNEEKSCIYHPGKLKYYSCRSCGGDEYYTCCMKCSRCMPGCKTGKHIAGI